MLIALSFAKGALQMQVAIQIDKLINELNKLKPLLSEDNSSNARKFSEILENASTENSNSEYELNPIHVTEGSNVGHQNYQRNSEHTRKPNMREFIEAISGKSIEDLYAEPEENWKKIFQSAEEILYGVVGSNKDTRDWSAIMSSSDILTTAKLETGKMYSPTIDIATQYNTSGVAVNQTAIIKDRNENILRTIPQDLKLAEETLVNFGATHSSVPANIEEKVLSGKFNNNLLDLLKNFQKNSDQIEQVVLRATSEVISERLSNEIPLQEFNKL